MIGLYNRGVFTARYGLIPYIKQITFRLLKVNKEIFNTIFVISVFRRKVDEICALLQNYLACSGKTLAAFWDNLSVPSSRVAQNSTVYFPNTNYSGS